MSSYELASMYAVKKGAAEEAGLCEQDEVFYFEKMEVNDFRNDVLLAEACRSDVDKFCKHTEPGA